LYVIRQTSGEGSERAGRKRMRPSLPEVAPKVCSQTLNDEREEP
jgi:hypothetical protein